MNVNDARSLPWPLSCLTPTAGGLAVQITRYALVGGIAFMADMGLLSLLAMFGAHYLLAAASGFMLGLLTNYALSVSFVFPRRKLASRSLEMLIFTGVGFAGLAWTELIMWTGVDKLDLSIFTAKMIATLLVLIWNFTARKLLLF